MAFLKLKQLPSRLSVVVKSQFLPTIWSPMRVSSTSYWARVKPSALRTYMGSPVKRT